MVLKNGQNLFVENFKERESSSGWISQGQEEAHGASGALI